VFAERYCGIPAKHCGYHYQLIIILAILMVTVQVSQDLVVMYETPVTRRAFKNNNFFHMHFMLVLPQLLR
jgi:hypothetical protein